MLFEIYVVFMSSFQYKKIKAKAQTCATYKLHYMNRTLQR